MKVNVKWLEWGTLQVLIPLAGVIAAWLCATLLEVDVRPGPYYSVFAAGDLIMVAMLLSLGVASHGFLKQRTLEHKSEASSTFDVMVYGSLLLGVVFALMYVLAKVAVLKGEVIEASGVVRREAFFALLANWAALLASVLWCTLLQIRIWKLRRLDRGDA